MSRYSSYKACTSTHGCPVTEEGTRASPTHPAQIIAAQRPANPSKDRCPTTVDNAVLSTRDAAEYLGLSPKTLETNRTRGGGPPFVKLGRRVVYRRGDLDAWLAERVRQSTSDCGEC